MTLTRDCHRPVWREFPCMELIRGLHMVLDDRVDELMENMALAWYDIAYPTCILLTSTIGIHKGFIEDDVNNK